MIQMHLLFIGQQLWYCCVSLFYLSFLYIHIILNFSKHYLNALIDSGNKPGEQSTVKILCQSIPSLVSLEKRYTSTINIQNLSMRVSGCGRKYPTIKCALFSVINLDKHTCSAEVIKCMGISHYNIKVAIIKSLFYLFHITHFPHSIQLIFLFYLN